MLPFALKVVWFCLSFSGKIVILLRVDGGYLIKRIHRDYSMLGSSIYVLAGHR